MKVRMFTKRIRGVVAGASCLLAVIAGHGAAAADRASATSEGSDRHAMAVEFPQQRRVPGGIATVSLGTAKRPPVVHYEHVRALVTSVGPESGGY